MIVFVKKQIGTLCVIYGLQEEEGIFVAWCCSKFLLVYGAGAFSLAEIHIRMGFIEPITSHALIFFFFYGHVLNLNLIMNKNIYADLLHLY